MIRGKQLQAVLPALIQDALRLTMDTLSPTRRQSSSTIGHSSVAISMAVSPDGTVLGGPFEGLRLPASSSWGGLPARLAGSYEEEIAPRVVEALKCHPRRIIDIGAAEGYYAVGIARALPGSEVVAFEMDPYGRRLCRETVKLNRVTNVRVRGRATPKVLNRSLSRGALLLCDCEGYEVELINPRTVPALRQADAIIEVHEFVSPGVTDLLIRRLEPTHVVTQVAAVPRSASGRAQLSHLEPSMAALAVDEGRPMASGPMAWLVCRRRDRV